VEHFDVNGRTYAWNSNTGTSMSTPVVSGAIALWLQAKPDLTPQDILKVFERTCSHYDPTLSYPNNYYGYGQIDVYRGLLDIVGIDKIEGISSHQVQRVKCRPADGILYVDIEEEGKKGSMTVSIYATNGILMKQARIDDTAGTHRIDISNLPKGIYAVQVNGGTPSTTGSMLFRQ
jgi:subtilisin family serine protease